MTCGATSSAHVAAQARQFHEHPTNQRAAWTRNGKPGRCWRCDGPCGDTTGHARTRSRCPRDLGERRRRPLFDRVGKLLTACPSTIRALEAIRPGGPPEVVAGPGCRRPPRAGGTQIQQRTDNSRRFLQVLLTPAGARWTPLGTAVIRWLPILNWAFVATLLHRGRHESRGPCDGRGAWSSLDAAPARRLLGPGAIAVAGAVTQLMYRHLLV